ncbi:MAG: TetR/AcrR family transcriptional regulator [Bacteriovoracaceae bacterium]|nr:TetR/AcrR family transcriptional regulator [Bacteriovoracaceae bacterium]
MHETPVNNESNSSKSLDKADVLMNAALEVFLEKGFHQTRIEDIIAKAKVGKGTFYLYYKNKEEVVDRCLENFRREIGKTLTWVHENVNEDADLTDVFLSEAKMLAETLENNQIAGKFLFREGRAVGPSIDKKMSDYYLELVDMSENTLALAMAAGLVKKLHPRVSSMCIIGGVVQIFYHWLEGDISSDVDDLLRETVRFYSSSLGLEFERGA